jgi:mono/diheme cytochrome c family protein
MKKRLANAALVVLLAGCASTPEGTPASAAAPPPDAPVADEAPAAESSSGNGYYTVGQARRGAGLFLDNCLSCHASSEFAGSSFERRWRRQSVGDLYEFVLYSMPDDNPGGLPEQTYADVIAYVLELNDLPAGDTELTTSIDALLQMMMWEDTSGGGDQ